MEAIKRLLRLQIIALALAFMAPTYFDLSAGAAYAQEKQLTSKEKQRAEKEKQRVAREKEKQRIAQEKEKEKQRVAQEKDKQRIAQEKEKEKQRAAQEKDKQRIAQEKEKEKQRVAQEKDKQRIAQEKEKGKQRIAQEKEKGKQRIAQEKEKGKQRAAQEKDKQRIAKEREKQRVAQEREKRGFFDRLFAIKRPPAQENVSKRQSSTQKKKAQSPVNKPKKLAAVSVPKPKIQKSEQARRILVIGDFIAAHVADGLSALYANDPDIIIIKQVQAASGLVRDDHYDWPGQMDKIVEAQRPNMIIVALGSNDRQSLKTNGQSIDYGSEEWVKHYRSRMVLLTKKLEGYTSPWAWLGLPPFQQHPLNSMALTVNSYLSETISGTENPPKNGHFIDIWRGFADDEGNFNFSGYDINGIPTRLRTNDGINFTVAGRAKLAFYANEAVQSLLTKTNLILSQDEENDLSLVPIISSQESIQDTEIEPQNVKYIAPQALIDMVDNTQELAGAPQALSLLKSASPLSFPSSRLTVPPQGRADYFFND